ncbi:MAG: lipopolysaccharide biosynthesis protein [Ruminococcus sp.]
MNNNIKALKSGVWYTIASFATKSIGFITTPIFTRILTHEEFGLYNNYTSWLSILTIFVTLNLESTFISARYDYENRFDSYIFSSLVLSTLSAAFWFILLNFGNFFERISGVDKKYINCMVVYLIFLPAINMFQARERYYFKYKMSVLISTVVSVGTALLSVVLVVFLKINCLEEY